MWFEHSRRMEPITRSAYAFCQGERGARVANSSFPERYTEEVRRRLGELEEEEPNPEADTAWCGVR